MSTQPSSSHSFDRPPDLPPELLGRCAAVVLDPPYLNVPTLREFFVSARLLAKPKNAVGGDKDAPPCIVVTGAWVCWVCWGGRGEEAGSI